MNILTLCCFPNRVLLKRTTQHNRNSGTNPGSQNGLAPGGEDERGSQKLRKSIGNRWTVTLW